MLLEMILVQTRFTVEFGSSSTDKSHEAKNSTDFEWMIWVE